MAQLRRYLVESHVHKRPEVCHVANDALKRHSWLEIRDVGHWGVETHQLSTAAQVARTFQQAREHPLGMRNAGLQHSIVWPLRENTTSAHGRGSHSTRWLRWWVGGYLARDRCLVQCLC